MSELSKKKKKAIARILGYYDGIPIVEAEVEGVQATFKCPWCGKTHYHGAEEEFLAGELSHRAAHCVDREVKGYYLKLEGSP